MNWIRAAGQCFFPPVTVALVGGLSALGKVLFVCERADTVTIRTPIAMRGHSGGITVTVSRDGNSGLYVHDMYADRRPRQAHPSVESAQAEADAIVRDVGHVCGSRCTGWPLLD
jgi:hypothetical protein